MATEDVSAKTSPWSAAVKTIESPPVPQRQFLCVRLLNWPIDRRRRKQGETGKELTRGEVTPAISASPRLRVSASVSPPNELTRGRGETQEEELTRRKLTSEVSPSPRPRFSASISSPNELTRGRGETEKHKNLPVSASSPSPTPLLIVRRVAERQVILAVSAEAHASGIRRGMTLTQARALRTTLPMPTMSRKPIDER